MTGALSPKAKSNHCRSKIKKNKGEKLLVLNKNVKRASNASFTSKSSFKIAKFVQYGTKMSQVKLMKMTLTTAITVRSTRTRICHPRGRNADSNIQKGIGGAGQKIKGIAANATSNDIQ